MTAEDTDQENLAVQVALQEVEEEDDIPEVGQLLGSDPYRELIRSRGLKGYFNKLCYWKPSIFALPISHFVFWNLLLMSLFLGFKFGPSKGLRILNVNIYKYVVFVWISFNVFAVSISVFLCVIRIIQFVIPTQRVAFYTSGLERSAGFITWAITVNIYWFKILPAMDHKGYKWFDIATWILLIIGVTWMFNHFLIKILIEWVRHKELMEVQIKERCMEAVDHLSNFGTKQLKKDYAMNMYSYISTGKAAENAFEFDSIEDCVTSSKRFFKRFNQGRKDPCFTEEDFVILYGEGSTRRDEEFAKDLFPMFRQSRRGRIDEDDFLESMIKMYKEQRRRVDNLENSADISGVMSRTLTPIVWFIAFIICLWVAGLDVYSLLLPFSGFFLATTFVFGSTLAQAFQSLIFLLFVDAFNVGDFIKVDGIVAKVETISLMVTTARNPDGRLYQFPNPVLSKKVINNLTRSYDYTFNEKVGVSASTKEALITKLEKQWKKYISTHQQMWDQDSAFLRVGGLETNNTYQVHFWVIGKFQPWEFAGGKTGWLNKRSDMLRAIRKSLGDLGITYEFPVQAVKLMKEGENAPQQGDDQDDDGDEDDDQQTEKLITVGA
mmetsp:Transcript_20708/g.23017  ORF Transcript_20708/g.23017 Transcript_20708/m.23017 type:complete len:607 (+) Transcript_20708:56-1876(+)